MSVPFRFERPVQKAGSRYLRVYKGGAVMISRSKWEDEINYSFEMNTMDGGKGDLSDESSCRSCQLLHGCINLVALHHLSFSEPNELQ